MRCLWAKQVKESSWEPSPPFQEPFLMASGS